MTLKTAKNIETAIRILASIIILPLSLIAVILIYLKIPFEWFIGEIISHLRVLGNRLMLSSDEVKNKTIQNKDVLKTGTAREAFYLLKKEREKEEKLNQ